MEDEAVDVHTLQAFLVVDSLDRLLEEFTVEGLQEIFHHGEVKTFRYHRNNQTNCILNCIQQDTEKI